MTRSPNQCAFPVHPETEGSDEGLTIREYYAALAMQGLLAGRGVSQSFTDVALARDSFAIAEAMIAASRSPAS